MIFGSDRAIEEELDPIEELLWKADFSKSRRFFFSDLSF